MTVAANTTACTSPHGSNWGFLADEVPTCLFLNTGVGQPGAQVLGPARPATVFIAGEGHPSFTPGGQPGPTLVPPGNVEAPQPACVVSFLPDVQAGTGQQRVHCFACAAACSSVMLYSYQQVTGWPMRRLCLANAAAAAQVPGCVCAAVSLHLLEHSEQDGIAQGQVNPGRQADMWRGVGRTTNHWRLMLTIYHG